MAEPRMNKDGDKELDLGKLLWILLKNIWLIGIFACAGFAAVFIYLNNFTPNLYTASASMYVYINNPNQVNYQYTSQADLNTATRLMETYMVVIRSNKVMGAVAGRLGPEYSPRFIASTLSVGSVGGTEVMRISATTPDPTLSMDICNAVAEFAPPEIIRVVNAGSVEVIDYASLPAQPNDKGVATKSLLGAVVGAGLVCGVLLLRMLFDDRIDSGAALKEHYDLPLLAAIPDLKWRVISDYEKRRRKKRGAPKEDRKPRGPFASGGDLGSAARGASPDSRLAISENTSPVVVEIYKMLRVNLLFSMGEGSRNAVIVTSAVPAEGKSTVCANLAVVIAQSSPKVLLIDADMRKPKQSGLFNLKGTGRGLSTLLQGIDRFEDVVHREVRPGLDVLPAGRAPRNPLELLGSENMTALLSRLRTEYSVVMIDTPPVNMVADALALSGEIAGAVFVVRYQNSTLKETNAALSAMNFVGMKTLGFIMAGTRGKYEKIYHKRDYYYSSNNTGRYSAYPASHTADRLPRPGDLGEERSAQ